MDQESRQGRARCAWGCTLRGVFIASALCATIAGAPRMTLAQTPAAIEVRESRATGLAAFVTATDGGMIPVSAAGGQPTPRDFLLQHGRLFGIDDPDAQLRVVRSEVCPLGQTHTTYRQMHGDIPVFSGVLKVHQAASGEILAANGDFYPVPAKLSTAPQLSAEQAEAVVLDMMRPLNVTITSAELVIVDPGWYGDPPRGARLAYHVSVVDATHRIQEAFFVDARTGEILDRWSLVHSAKDRQIHDGEGSYDQDELPGILVRAEGDPPVTSPQDANRAYDYYGDVYDYFMRAFGRDGIDGNGLPMVATVNSEVPGCPNAFWSPPLLQMVFCDGMVVDDIVAHELTHGITQFTADLIYQNQPGQLNEAVSDIFGELVDLYNGDASVSGPPGGTPWPVHDTGPGRDTPNSYRTGTSFPPDYAAGVRWILGEDAGPGPIRDMWDPESYGSPARANSPLMTCSHTDGGGVHFGSGVPNHAFAMMTDGKSFNGQTVTAIGPIKAGAVWYRALTQYFTTATDFQDAYAALNRAATDLVGTFPNDPRTGMPSASMFTEENAADVNRALLAVEMNTPGACGVYQLLDPEPPAQCADRVTIYSDDFESGINGWTVGNTSTGASYNWIQTADLPDGRPGVGWFVEDRRTSCTSGVDASGLHRLTSPPIRMPASFNYPVLAFEHFVAIERNWDGGVVQLKVNNGPWFQLPGHAFLHNPYNLPRLYPSDSGNPLGGLAAFSGLGGQWYTSLVNLGPYLHGGETIQVRFELGKDYCEGLIGWYVDDVLVYDCPTTSDCNANGIPDENEISAGPQPEELLFQPPSYAGTAASDAGNFASYITVRAENFFVYRPKAIHSVTVWGFPWSGSGQGAIGGNHFTVIIHEDGGGVPGEVIATRANMSVSWSAAGVQHYGVDVYEIECLLDPPVPLDPGSYYLEFYDNSTSPTDLFFWEVADLMEDFAHAVAYEAPGVVWTPASASNLAIRINGGMLGEDCNANDTPDDCEPNTDCNTNGVQDICDVGGGTSTDCDVNDFPDECQPDNDGDGVIDGCDDCPADPDKTDPGICGCGVPDSLVDTDGDTVPDCIDVCSNGDDTINADGDSAPDCAEECPNDPLKLEPGQCGCGMADADGDGDGVANCVDNCLSMSNPTQADSDGDHVGDACDGCPGDPNKTAPGVCGCGRSDADADSDGIRDCFDNCPSNANAEQIDTDHDGAGNACDGCPADATKTAPGDCGCGFPETDGDDDGVVDCVDECPMDPDKFERGACGCGVAETDSDGDDVPDCVDMCTNGDDSIDADNDGTPDCADDCPDDPGKTEPGACGCGTPDADPDADDVPTCLDNCPNEPNVNQLDNDGDGVGDACDGCPTDAAKLVRGVCGCGVPDTDTDGDGRPDCMDNCVLIDNVGQADADQDGLGDACDGCPEDPAKVDPGRCGCGVSDRDGDFDGVPDCIDACPRTRFGALIDSNGCEIDDGPSQRAADADGDGIANIIDRCPDTPPGQAVGLDGCPLQPGDKEPGQDTPDNTECGAGAPCGTMGAASLSILLLGLGAMKPRRRK